MSITMARRDDGSQSPLERLIRDIAAKVFPVAALVTVVLYAWLLYGLFSGQLADVPKMPQADRLHVLQLIGNITLGIKVSLALALLGAIALFYESAATGWVMTALAALLAYGLQFGIAFVENDPTRFLKGKAAGLALGSLHTSAIMLAIPGVTLILRALATRMRESRYGADLATMQYGAKATQEKKPSATLGVLAKCWQLPFCREGIRVKCPIYHAKTKCWKERVGCMCEENIIRVAMGDAHETHQDLTKQGGFVPIGDLISQNESTQRPQIPMRVGPRGVKIPTNPHLTDRQKKERCRNCVIYNEHQRMKYQFLSPPITLAVPLLAYLNFESLRVGVSAAMRGLDSLVAHLSFSGVHNTGPSDLTRNVSGSLPVETIIIACLGLIALSWSLRALEYCIFKIKI